MKSPSHPPNFFQASRAFPKIGTVAFLTPIFGNVDGSWCVTSKLRGSTLIQVARRRSKVFQRFSASLVRVGDVQGGAARGSFNSCIIFLKKVTKYNTPYFCFFDPHPSNPPTFNLPCACECSMPNL